MPDTLPQRREHFWDGLRAFLMILGIPYHVMLSYRVDDQWIVRSGEGVPGFAFLADVIHVFRMPAFFVVAGYFAGRLLERRAPGAWMKGRLRRLLPPFLATLLLLVPAMNLACEVSNLDWQAAWPSFLHNSATSGGYWIRHLWFIVVLLYGSAALAAAHAVRPGLADWRLSPARDAAWSRHPFLVLALVAAATGLWEAAVLEGFYKAGLATNVPQAILRLDELIVYGPWIALGAALSRMPGLLARLCQFEPAVLVVALLATALTLGLKEAVTPAEGRFVEAFAATAWTQSLIAAARTWLDRPSRLVRELTASSFVIYLFHLPLICVLVWLGQGVALPTPVKALVVMALALLLSWLAWRAIRKVELLLRLFDGSTRAEEARRRQAAMA